MRTSSVSVLTDDVSVFLIVNFFAAYNAPFVMYIHSDAKSMSESPSISHQKGFLLKFSQVPC